VGAFKWVTSAAACGDDSLDAIMGGISYAVGPDIPASESIM
jgi:hypothetical protein